MIGHCLPKGSQRKAGLPVRLPTSKQGRARTKELV